MGRAVGRHRFELAQAIGEVDLHAAAVLAHREVHRAFAADRGKQADGAARLQAQHGAEDLVDDPHGSDAGAERTGEREHHAERSAVIEREAHDAEHGEEGRDALDGERLETAVAVDVNRIHAAVMVESGDR